MGNRKIYLTSKAIALFFGMVVTFLVIANLLIIYLRFVRGYEHLRGFIDGFYFDREANFPSLYSSIAIVFCSVLLWRIGSTPEEKSRNQSLQWKFLAFVFLFLAMDEFGSLHEYLIGPMNALVARVSLESDYLYFAWFIPYTIVTLVLALFYLKFFFKLPSWTRMLFALAAVVFIVGAVGMEMVGGKYWAAQGWAIGGTDGVDINYALIVTLEEFLEMAGIVIFIYALSKYYLKNRLETYEIHVSEARPKSS